MKKYEQPDFSIHNTLYLFSMCVALYCFNFLCLAVLEKTVTKTFGIHDLPTVHVRATEILKSKLVRSIDDVIDVIRNKLTCYLFWSSGLSSPTRLVALPRPLAGGQGHNIASVNN